MTDIARKSGISVGALYLRFKSKEQLCLELIKDMRADFDRLTGTLPLQDPLKALRAYIDLNLEFGFKKKQMLSMLLREHRLPFIKPMGQNFLKTQQKIISDIISSGVKKGIFRKTGTKETVYIIFACIRGAILLKHVFGIGNIKITGSALFKLITDGLRKQVS